MRTILIVDDDLSLARTLEIYFRRKKYGVSVTGAGEKALSLWHSEAPDLILLDVQLPDMDGAEVLARAKKERLKGEVVMITAYHDTDAVLKAIRLGAADYLYKPLSMRALDLVLENVLNQKEHLEKAARFSHVISKSYEHDQVVGTSTKTLELIKAIAKVSETRATVLIEGETGTGKELVARTIHQQSFAREPFIAINCANFVGTLIESELFGHEKGAFTGAIQRKVGKFECANSGTILLDEIGELPLDFQPKLLRVLQEHEFQTVGGTRTIPLRARILAATNRDLAAMVKEGSFREDLYYRLNIFAIRIAPLRDRPEDILPLTEYFVGRFNREMQRGVRISRIPLPYIDALKGHAWPGNIRELQNVVQRGYILSQGDCLELDMDWLRVSRTDADEAEGQIISAGGVPPSLADVEKAHILKTLAYTRWNHGEACKILGISRPTLRKKISDYSLSLGKDHVQVERNLTPAG